jgi:hypothetical protein
MLAALEEQADRPTRVRQDGVSPLPQKICHQGTIPAGKTRLQDAVRLPHVRRHVLRTGLNASPGVEAVPGQANIFAPVHAVGQIQSPNCKVKSPEAHLWGPSSRAIGDRGSGYLTVKHAAICSRASCSNGSFASPNQGKWMELVGPDSCDSKAVSQIWEK